MPACLAREYSALGVHHDHADDDRVVVGRKSKLKRSPVVSRTQLGLNLRGGKVDIKIWRRPRLSEREVLNFLINRQRNRLCVVDCIHTRRYDEYNHAQVV